MTATFMPGLMGRVWLSFFSSTMLSIAAFSASARWAPSQTMRLFTYFVLGDPFPTLRSWGRH
jgi:hypothetical protein